MFDLVGTTLVTPWFKRGIKRENKAGTPKRGFKEGKIVGGIIVWRGEGPLPGLVREETKRQKDRGDLDSGVRKFLSPWDVSAEKKNARKRT